MTTLSPTRYLYPPRARGVLPFQDQAARRDLQTFGYLAQYKFNDSRCLVKHLPDGQIQLWNRHGERFRDYTAPDWLQDQLHAALAQLGLSPAGYHLLDGGLLDKKHPKIKDTIALWDILIRDGEHLRNTTYHDRYHTLWTHTTTPHTYPGGTTVGAQLQPNIFVPHQIRPADWDAAWASVQHENQPYPPHSPLLEGLVFKDPAGRLEPGYREQNNGHWMIRSRVETGRHRF